LDAIRRAREYYLRDRSWLETVYSSVHAVFAVAKVRAFYSREKALAIFLVAVGLLTVAAFFQGQLRPLSDEL
jgi:hypothetical protein